MKNKLSDKMESGRVRRGPYGSNSSYGLCGMFHVTAPGGATLFIMSGDGEDTGWEHVSVSKKRHPPNWEEMCWVKNQFWNDDECVVQYHPPKASYVNNMATCLHLWRPKLIMVPQPPDILVGIKSLGELDKEKAAT
jgi:hypothetical protein